MAWAARAETPTQHIWHFASHFTAFAELFALLFLVVSFRDSLAVEVPVILRVESCVERLTKV